MCRPRLVATQNKKNNWAVTHQGTHKCLLKPCELGRERAEEENASELGVEQQQGGKRKKMFLKVQLPWNVIIPAENLDAKGLMLQRSIVVCLLDDFAKKQATKDLGYYLAVSTLESIGEGKVRQQTGDVLFPVVFSGITFKIFRGEILEGVVHKVLKHGVLLKCGPIENIYLSSLKMPDYRYVPGENPVFLNDKTSKIGKDVVVRFVVLGTKWLEAEREFQALVSLEGDYLGPSSHVTVRGRISNMIHKCGIMPPLIALLLQGATSLISYPLKLLGWT
ncbi:hypothetical protein SADUNF_Sadunf10G0032600 [Salix dunnii]|uniref:DNA-directed RNA polymerase subunit n=1 Tax=Salix dunnii TaxID=1413687 RepID=A0A835JS05_9ROSI|nr:hypothetical protein SADUNF_Sadunf10G0032600 [Salix dunnii]